MKIQQLVVGLPPDAMVRTERLPEATGLNVGTNYQYFRDEVAILNALPIASRFIAGARELH